ncbi:hypothetical protein E1263_02810 [Kribbella antibiotica]|uniref:Uncharacterized protein n=1 Tax=Kribbella antibiotica TaxID=190195 RepID=A0A4R4ZUX2_9ACTN|nr:hypothetical protein [Kribbella antibiotica]TDD62665.1 hypothetical protein E1263_02810 [Kribbella antibiotica]
MNRSIKLAGLVASVSVAAVVAGALVAAQQTPTLAAASGGNANPISSTTTKPSTTPSKPSGTPSSTPGSTVKLTLDLTKLKQGAAPKASYMDGRTVHFGATKFTLPATDGPVWDIARAGTKDALVLSSPGDTGKGSLTTWTAGKRGETVKDVSTVRSSADRSTSAYAIQPTSADGTELAKYTLVWRENGSGEKYELKLTGEHGPIVHAVQGSEIYFSALNKSGKQNLYKWIAGDDAPKAVNSAPSPSAVSSNLQLAASIVSTSNDGSCTALVDLANGQKRWGTCDYGVDEILGGSTFALGGPAYRDGYSDGLFAALDLKNGRPIREWGGGSKVAIISTTMEDATHILVLAEQGGKTAIARCTPKDGTCELATPVKAGAEDSRPYYLGA